MFVTSDFLLLFPCLSFAAAALLPFHPSIIQLPTTNTSSSPPAEPRPHHPLERISYLVPHTSTFLDILLFTDRPLSPVDVEVVLSAIEVQLTNHIDQQSDGPLGPGDDPYDFGVSGCWCSAASTRKNSLTYKVLRDSIQGLQTLLVDQQRFYVAYWEIKRGPGGRTLGDGRLEDHKPGRRSPKA